MNRCGPYVLHERLGRGGMGVVFRAVHAESGREVAIKLLASDEPVARQRLVREALALARLRHENVLAVVDAGDGPGAPWVAFELVRGRSLQERLATEGPLSPREAASLLLAVSRGLAHAHGQGVLHRDLTPDNVLLPDDGGPSSPRGLRPGDLPLRRRARRVGARRRAGGGADPGFLACGHHASDGHVHASPRCLGADR